MNQTDHFHSADALQFITERYASLTDAEKQIANFLLSNPEEAVSMNVHTLAQKTGVSVATIVRYAQHMGFDGYKSFRLHFAQCKMGKDDFFLDFPDAPDSVENQVSKVLRADMEALRLTLLEMDYPALMQLARAILEAENVLFFGTGTSNIVCNDAMLKYLRTGKQTFSTCDIYSAALTVSNFHEKDLVIAVSHSGRNADAMRIIQTAAKANLRTAVITSFSDSPLASAGEMVLYTKTRESPLHNIAITSRIGQFALMDALFMAYLTLNYQNCAEHNQKLSEYLHTLGII